MTKQHTKERICQAALEVFSEKGYEGATTREIAKRADVNEVTLFRHFGNKKNLLDAVLEQFSTASVWTEELLAGMKGNLRSDLTLLAKSYLEIAVRQEDHLRLALLEAKRHPDLKEALSRIPRKLTKHLSDYFRKMAAEGKIMETDFDLLAHLFYGLLFQAVLTRSHQPSELNYLDREEKRNQWIEAVVDLFESRLTRTTE